MVMYSSHPGSKGASRGLKQALVTSRKMITAFPPSSVPRSVERERSGATGERSRSFIMFMMFRRQPHSLSVRHRVTRPSASALSSCRYLGLIGRRSPLSFASRLRCHRAIVKGISFSASLFDTQATVYCSVIYCSWVSVAQVFSRTTVVSYFLFHIRLHFRRSSCIIHKTSFMGLIHRES
jgi:hypothetical protein